MERRLLFRAPSLILGYEFVHGVVSDLVKEPTGGDSGFRHIFALPLVANSPRTGLPKASNRSSKAKEEKMGSRLLTTTAPVDINVHSFLLVNGEGETRRWLMERKSQVSQPLPML